MQLSLLASGNAEALVDDGTARIVYRRTLFSDDQARLWFEWLRDKVAWRAERRPMYDRVVDVPRLVGSYALSDPELPEPIALMRGPVEQFCNFTFNAAGLNFYRDGNDSVAPHGDHVERGPVGAPVALVSLGSARRMRIRSKSSPRRVVDLDLEPGSLLLMDYRSHLNYEHGIPKTRDAVGQRISVAYRSVFKAGR
ncbi:MAG TPA: alpha-ketoglutarate-dependent dioxygenase AlkB [Candidatus Eremiobacteraceae bacterium]|nr:alpha-ketoglutarate-dependent dioxygenase AlkB [Candidatus Eremiobacteraceae bacterium]